MDPVSAFVVTLVGAFAAAKSEEQALIVWRRELFEHAWREFFAFRRQFASDEELVLYDHLYENFELPPGWWWAVRYMSSLKRYVPWVYPHYLYTLSREVKEGRHSTDLLRVSAEMARDDAWSSFMIENRDRLSPAQLMAYDQAMEETFSLPPGFEYREILSPEVGERIMIAVREER